MAVGRTDRSVALYPVYAGLAGAHFWMPVFFLYFSERLTLAGVLRLEAIYYAAVVLLEVPSGYLSDRVGRRVTLLISAGAITAAHATFALSGTFAALAAAQVLLAAGIAFNSGTDASFHYDALAAEGREAEFDAREARAANVAFLAGAAAALLGGAAGAIDLRLAYVLSACAGAASLAVVWRCREPASHARTLVPPDGPIAQARACVRDLRTPRLAWLFGAMVLGVVVNHVPWEFHQPYIALLGQVERPAPLVAGMHAAVTMLIGSVVAGRSIALRDRWGLTGVVLAALALQAGVIGVMGLVLHPVVLLLVAFRSVPRALMAAPVNAAVVPLVDRRRRATFLSVQSLTGRLGFSGFLLALSAAAGADADGWPALSRLLTISGVVAASGLIALWATRAAMRGVGPDDPAADG